MEVLFIPTLTAICLRTTTNNCPPLQLSNNFPSAMSFTATEETSVIETDHKSSRPKVYIV